MTFEKEIREDRRQEEINAMKDEKFRRANEKIFEVEITEVL